MSDKISPDVAAQELERFFEAMDLDVDPEYMDDEDQKSFESNHRKLVRAIVCGNLVINDKGEPVYTPKGGDGASVTFHEPTGSSLQAMRGKRDADVDKLFGAMADMTHTSVATFSLMKHRDLKICTAIAGFLLGG